MAIRYPELDQARQIVAELEQQLEALDDSGPQHEAAISECSYAALVLKEPAAIKKLAALHKEAGEEASKRSAIEAAIREAQRRVAHVEERVRRLGQRQAATLVMACCDRFMATAARLDNAARELGAAAEQLATEFRDIQRLGISHPGPGAFTVFGKRALATLLMNTPLATDHVLAREQVTFTEFGAEWTQGWRQHSQTRIAGNKDDAPAPLEQVDDGAPGAPPVPQDDEIEHFDEELDADSAELAADRKSTRLNSSHPSISYAV